MEIRAICGYTGLSKSSAEYLHAHRTSRNGFLTRLIDGILCETDLAEKVPFWLLHSAQAALLTQHESSFAEDKCLIDNEVAYASGGKVDKYVIPPSAASEFYLHRAIEKATSKVAGVVTDMRNDILADIGLLERKGVEYFQWIKVDPNDIKEVSNGND